MQETLPAGWFKIPELQEGSVDPERQLRGLGPVRALAPGATVLDLGCAEGLVSLDLAKAGARLVHGVELLGDRLEVAERLFAEQYPDIERGFFEWDLNHFEDLFLDRTPDSNPGRGFLRARYDIVLCLAIAQKLSTPGRFLRLASTLCTKILAVRLAYPIIDDPRSFNVPVDVKRLLSEDFELIQETEGYPLDPSVPYRSGDYAWLAIFRRTTTPPD